MTLQEDGRWRLTMPVEAGSYYYKFVVEGVDKKDQTNPTSVLSEPNWSTFQVPGDETLRGEYTTPVAPEDRGSVEVMNYTSSANGNPTRSAYVWTPPDYDPDPETPATAYVLDGGFLDRVDTFDTQLFGIAPDGGTGSLEALIFLSLLLLLAAWGGRRVRDHELSDRD